MMHDEGEEGRRRGTVERRRGGRWRRRRGGAKIASAYIREQTVEMWEGTSFCPQNLVISFS